MTDEPGKEGSEAKQAVPGKSDAKGSAPKKFAPRTAKSQNKFAHFQYVERATRTSGAETEIEARLRKPVTDRRA
jgi:hypothetical protein